MGYRRKRKRRKSALQSDDWVVRERAREAIDPRAPRMSSIQRTELPDGDFEAHLLACLDFSWDHVNPAHKGFNGPRMSSPPGSGFSPAN